MVTKKCDVCGKDFETKFSSAKRCSEQCRRIGRDLQIRAYKATEKAKEGYRIASAKWRANNPERRKEIVANFRLRHHERLLQLDREKSKQRAVKDKRNLAARKRYAKRKAAYELFTMALYDAHVKAKNDQDKLIARRECSRKCWHKRMAQATQHELVEIKAAKSVRNREYRKANRDRLIRSEQAWRAAHPENTVRRNFVRIHGYEPPEEVVQAAAANLLIKRKLKELKNAKHN